MTNDAIAGGFWAAPHALLRIRGAEALRASGEMPGWVETSLRRAPWVVVRRARCGERIPVGVRGESRAARFAAFMAAREVMDCMTPQAVAARRLWEGAARRTCVAAIAALPAVEGIMRAHGLATQWGPAGSVGYELVCGQPTANEASDLDLVVQIDAPPSTTAARALYADLTSLAVRIDALMEMPAGGVALADCAGTRPQWALRTSDGPRWMNSVRA